MDGPFVSSDVAGEEAGRLKVLIVSASMGAGHDGAARELQRRLERKGHEVTVVDFLAAFPMHTGTLVRSGYEWELRLAPWAYESAYRLYYRRPGLHRPISALVSAVTGRRMRTWVSRHRPDVVVSTYPLASLVLGRDRKRGRLGVPAATFITDFAVHPLWTHAGIDEHLCVHPQSATAAAERTHGAASAPGPLISQQFNSGFPTAGEARDRLGIQPSERLVLLVAGSWGVGEVEETFDDVVATGRYTPLAACGRNDRLRRNLEARGVGHVMGWTDQMPALMAASDALVQNAGGLTCMEAFAAGLPVVSYRPIAGHGLENASEMERAGVAAYARQPAELGPALDKVTGPGRDELLENADAMFDGDAATDVIRLARPSATGSGAGTEGLPAPVFLPRAHPRRRVAASVAAAAAVVWLAFTLGVGVATANGIGTVRPVRGGDTAYVALRVGPGAIDNAALPGALAGAHVTAIVDGSLAADHPDAVRRFTSAGVDVANGGWGHRTQLQWRRAHADLKRSAHAIEGATGVQVHDFMPARRINGFDLTWARLAHERVVLPNSVSRNGVPRDFDGGLVYLVDAREADGVATLRMIDELQQRLAADGLHSGTLSQLR